MDVQTIQCFVSVARHLNFTKAAKECHISQTAMSKKINSLENELGVALFYRDNRQVELTPAGTEFFSHAYKLLEVYNSAIIRTKDIAAGFKTSLKVGIGVYEHLMLFQPLKTYHAEHPEVDIICSQFQYKALAEHLTDQLIDVMVGTDEYLYTIPGVKSHIIDDSDWSFIVSPDSPFANREDVPINELSDVPFVTTMDGTHDQIRRSLLPFGLEPKRFYRVNSYNTQLLTVRANMGFASIPSFVVPYATGRLVRSLNTIPRYKPQKFVVAYREDTQNPAVMDFVDTLLEFVRTTPVEARQSLK